MLVMSKASVPPCAGVPPASCAAVIRTSTVVFELFVTVKAVAALTCPNATLVVVVPVSTTEIVTLRSTVITSDAGVAEKVVAPT
jgi:hypothetical protein